MEKIRAQRGTADAVPPDGAAWSKLEDRMRALASRFGYGEIRTPIFEATELFVRGVGDTTDIVEKEMYTFSDKGGRSVTLRPEITAPIVRALLEHNMLAAGTQRLFSIGPIFRYERPQAGRYRQPHQFDAEAFGFAQPEADVEIISLAAELLEECGIATTLALNSIGDGTCRPAYRAALIAYLDAHRSSLSSDAQARLDRNPLRVLDSKAPEDQAVVAGAPEITDALCEDCRRHFERVRELLDVCGIAYSVDPRIARGLDYYTRTVFEFKSDALGAQSTVCGGGRYDDLIASLGGPATPAVGFAIGIERLRMAMDASSTHASSASARSGIAVIALGEAARTPAFALTEALRFALGRHPEAGWRALPVIMDFSAAKLDAQLRRADRANARMAIIIGDDELARSSLTVRDLETREQTSLPVVARVTGEQAEAALAQYARLLERLAA